MLRHEAMTMSGPPRVELINMEWALKMKLCDLKSSFDHGMMIYVEEGSLKETKFTDLHWHQAVVFNEEMLKLHISLNEGAGGYQERGFEVKINRKKTLKELKDKIGDMVGLPASEFTIRRKHVVKEMKEVTLKLVELGVTNGAFLEIKRGKAHQEGRCELVVAFARLLQEEETQKKISASKEEKLFAKKLLGKIIVD